MSWLSAAWKWYAAEGISTGAPVYPHAGLVNPVVAGIGAALLIAAALQQASTARRRHREQTNADRQRRITESFAKATEQLGNDKIEVRLGGIYTLERISRESPEDYWTVMETLTAFVRERAPWKKADADRSETMASFYEGETSKSGPATDITAVLTVINRRNEKSRQQERKNKWVFDLRETDLKHCYQSRMHLHRAILFKADLSNAWLLGANLSKTSLWYTDLSNTILIDANLSGANLTGVNLSGASLGGADLSGANLTDADLTGAEGLSQPQLDRACGAGAKLPDGLTLKPCPGGLPPPQLLIYRAPT